MPDSYPISEPHNSGKGIRESDLEEINNLLAQLSSRAQPLNRSQLIQILNQKSLYWLVARHTTKNSDSAPIVGMAIIYIIQTPSKTKAVIEDVVVDKHHRGRAIGEKLIERLITVARNRNAQCIDLTSKPSRVAARKLYRKLGFRKRKTHFYRLELQ